MCMDWNRLEVGSVTASIALRLSGSHIGASFSRGADSALEVCVLVPVLIDVP
jgi:hypothetical protein